VNRPKVLLRQSHLRNDNREVCTDVPYLRGRLEGPVHHRNVSPRFAYLHLSIRVDLYLWSNRGDQGTAGLDGGGTPFKNSSPIFLLTPLEQTLL